MSAQCRSVFVAGLVAVSLLTPIAVKAKTDNFIGPSGQYWNTPGNWSLNAVPGFADFANIIAPTSGMFSVTFDDNYTRSTEPWTLTLDSTVGTLVFNQTIDNTNLFAHGEVIGSAGSAVFNQTTGSNSLLEVDEGLTLGAGNGSSGTYNLSGGALNVHLHELIGVAGNGSVVQSGGTNTAGEVDVGGASGGIGGYALSGGTLSSAIVVGTGSTFAQSGGSVIGVAPVIQGGTIFDAGQSIEVGWYKTAAATYQMSAGSITGNPALFVGGNSGNGKFLQSGGASNLTIASIGESGIGYYSLSGNASLTVSNYEFVGNAAAGTFEQTGGTHTVVNQLVIANGSQSTGSSYTLNSGTLSDGELVVGNLGSGVFVQTGGTHVVTDSLALGGMHAGTGAYNLSGGSLSASSEIVGLTLGSAQKPGGAFAQLGGTNSVSGTLYVGTNWGTGTYLLGDQGAPASSTLTASNEYVSFGGGTGTFTQIGGTNTISAGVNSDGTAHGLYVSESGTSPLVNGSYALSNGVLQSSYEAVAYADPGTFVQSGGTNTIGVQAGFPSLVVARYQTSGSYTLAGGTLSAAGNEIIGDSGNGTFNQSGGTHTAMGNLYLGNSAFGSGAFNLSGGSFSLTADEFVGYRSAGNFTQSGGTQTTNGSLYIAYNSGSTGTFTQAGGSAAFSSNAYVGGASAAAGGTGVLAVSGGQLSIANTLKVWNQPGNQLQLTGGTLSAGALDLDGNPSSFHWTGGMLRLTNGTTHLGDLTGAGLLAVGNPSGSHASVAVSSFNLSSVGIDNTGNLAVEFNSAPPVNSVDTLNISSGGQFDLANGTLFIRYAGSDPFTTIMAYLASGYDNGKWDGNGIISSTAANDPYHQSGIGIVDSADGLLHGLPPDTIELKYVLYGDTLLAGTVGPSDLADFMQHQGTQHGATWDTGDFNYDGAVDASDMALLDRGLNPVPEPTSILGTCMLLTLLRRRGKP